jgi:hypothetical protein
MGRHGLEEFQGLQVDMDSDIKERWDRLKWTHSNIRDQVRSESLKRIYGDVENSLRNFKLGLNAEAFVLLIVKKAGVTAANKIIFNNEGFRIFG